MKIVTRTVLAFIAIISLSISVLTWAGETNCNVCGMTIPEKARNHITLRSENEQKELHVCSIPCLKKAHKTGFTGKAQFADFNRAESFIPGDKAYFLVGSQKIKADMGEMAMPPYVGAFSSQKEANAAKTKYGDGNVIQGVDAVLK